MKTLASQSRREPFDDLSRNVFGVFGIPLDACDLNEVERRIRRAVGDTMPLLLSTPNLNFLFLAMRYPEFRTSLEQSDLCAVDGWPVLWLAWCLGLPLRRTAAGSDLWEQMKARSSQPLGVFLFGGAEGIAREACSKINEGNAGLECRGYLSPGFGDVAAMSDPGTLDKINSSRAQIICVSLGALKGQIWLLRNSAHLSVPVRAHLGAVVNFEAGAIKRAPSLVRSLGCEWLWRIKEERHLWSRYCSDGLRVIAFIVTNVIPLQAISKVMSAHSFNGVIINMVKHLGG